jgi:hypothetical protein
LTRPAELPALRFVVSLFCFVALIHVTTIGASAQQFTFQHFEQDEGLKNRDVFKLMQDKTGFLWSATENGLFRYDGAEFHHFGAANGIQESMVIDVYQDASGRIWTHLDRRYRPPSITSPTEALKRFIRAFGEGCVSLCGRVATVEFRPC